MGWVLLSEDARAASPAFFVQVGALLLLFVGLLFAALSLLGHIVRRNVSRLRPPR